MCNQADKTDLVSYLYDDLDGATRLAVERHLRGCADCRDELAGLRAVRTDLLAWTPPEPEFAFRIVNEPRAAQAANAPRAAATVLAPNVASWRGWLKPALGLAAAAVLVLAAAAGLARIEVRSGPDGWTFRTGATSEVSADARVAGFAAHDVNLPADAGTFAALERRISALETSSRDSAGVRSASLLNARANNEEMLKVVRDLLAQSEGRQKTELALRVAQVIRDVQTQRVADLNQFRQGLVRMDATVADEAAAHRELMNYIFSSNTTSNSRTK